MFDFYGKTYSSHLLMGAAGFPSAEILNEALEAAAVEVVSINLPPPGSGHTIDDLHWDWLESVTLDILPSTLGCRTAQEAIQLASEAREVFQTDLIKLHIDDGAPTAVPDTEAIWTATTQLTRSGFKVLPVLPADLPIARRFFDAGCQVLMPMGSPPGEGGGLSHREQLITLRDGLEEAILILTAGMGRPSHAADAMELGFDGVHVVSAIARAGDPVGMAEAFANAVDAGLTGYTAGLMTPETETAENDNPFWDL
jgi:thiazole synthase